MIRVDVRPSVRSQYLEENDETKKERLTGQESKKLISKLLQYLVAQAKFIYGNIDFDNWNNLNAKEKEKIFDLIKKFYEYSLMITDYFNFSWQTLEERKINALSNISPEEKLAIEENTNSFSNFIESNSLFRDFVKKDLAQRVSSAWTTTSDFEEKIEYLRTVFHDLNNVMGIIYGYANLIEMDEESDSKSIEMLKNGFIKFIKIASFFDLENLRISYNLQPTDQVVDYMDKVFASQNKHRFLNENKKISDNIQPFIEGNIYLDPHLDSNLLTPLNQGLVVRLVTNIIQNAQRVFTSKIEKIHHLANQYNSAVEEIRAKSVEDGQFDQDEFNRRLIESEEINNILKEIVTAREELKIDIRVRVENEFIIIIIDDFGEGFPIDGDLEVQKGVIDLKDIYPYIPEKGKSLYRKVQGTGTGLAGLKRDIEAIKVYDRNKQKLREAVFTTGTRVDHRGKIEGARIEIKIPNVSAKDDFLDPHKKEELYYQAA